jgi:hypothetical protein
MLFKRNPIPTTRSTRRDERLVQARRDAAFAHRFTIGG